MLLMLKFILCNIHYSIKNEVLFTSKVHGYIGNNNNTINNTIINVI